MNPSLRVTGVEERVYKRQVSCKGCSTPAESEDLHSHTRSYWQLRTSAVGGELLQLWELHVPLIGSYHLFLSRRLRAENSTCASQLSLHSNHSCAKGAYFGMRYDFFQHHLNLRIMRLFFFQYVLYFNFCMLKVMDLVEINNKVTFKLLCHFDQNT